MGGVKINDIAYMNEHYFQPSGYHLAVHKVFGEVREDFWNGYPDCGSEEYERYFERN